MLTHPNEPNHLAPSIVDVTDGMLRTQDSYPGLQRVHCYQFAWGLPTSCGSVVGSRSHKKEVAVEVRGGLLGVAMILFGTSLGALIGGGVATYWNQGDV